MRDRDILTQLRHWEASAQRAGYIAAADYYRATYERLREQQRKENFNAGAVERDPVK